MNVKLRGLPGFLYVHSRYSLPRFEFAIGVEKMLRPLLIFISDMLQTLLPDRFKLKFRRETKDIPGYALVVASNGAKLQESTGVADISSIKVHVAPCSKRSESPEGLNKLTAQKTSMAQLASALTYLPGMATAPVINETGLPGFYNFEFSWESGESLSPVLQRQLGLMLVAQKVPADYSFIESTEKSREN